MLKTNEQENEKEKTANIYIPKNIIISFPFIQMLSNFFHLSPQLIFFLLACVFYIETV